MHTGQRIKEQRKLLKISVEELGARIGKDRSTIYRYENGQIENISIDILKKIAVELNISLQYLLIGELCTEDTCEKYIIRAMEDAEYLKSMKLLYLLDKTQLVNLNNMLKNFFK